MIHTCVCVTAVRIAAMLNTTDTTYVLATLNMSDRLQVQSLMQYNAASHLRQLLCSVLTRSSGTFC